MMTKKQTQALKQQEIWGDDLPPRERLIQAGANTLSDSELLAIFLRTGLVGTNVMVLAKSLLNNFGSLHGLMSADYTQFCNKRGLGKAKYAQLHAALELSKRFLSNQLARECALSNPDVTYSYLISLLSPRDREIFIVMFLDNQNRVISTEEMFSGTYNCVEVHPREIVRSALKHNAASVILAHNHPSGMMEPSQADKKITQRIQQACALLEINVLDHIVIGHGDYVSFAERGLI